MTTGTFHADRRGIVATLVGAMACAAGAIMTGRITAAFHLVGGALLVAGGLTMIVGASLVLRRHRRERRPTPPR